MDQFLKKMAAYINGKSLDLNGLNQYFDDGIMALKLIKTFITMLQKL